MTVEELFEHKPTDNADNDLIFELTQKILGALPTDEAGEIDWRETGCVLGDHAARYMNEMGIAAQDPAQANRVIIGTLLSAGKALYNNRGKFLDRRQQRDLTMLIGFLEATGCFNKVASMLMKNGFKE